MKKFNAVGAYIFAGGFSLGVQKHFNLLAHLEDGPFGVKTAKLNFPKLPIYVGQRSWPLSDLVGPDLLFGNPPCAAWSSLTGHLYDGWRSDERVKCTQRHFQLIEELRPKIWVWESVERAFMIGRDFIDPLAERAAAQGYATTFLLVDAQYLNVAHRRKRFFMLCHKVEVRFEEPDWSKVILPMDVLDHVKPDHVRGMPKDHVTLCDDLGPDESLHTAWTRRFGHEMKYRTTSTGKQFVIGRPAFKIKRLNPDVICRTIVDTNLIHPREPRLLANNEIAALCGYPADFRFSSRSSAPYEMTRAVMPPVAAWLAKQLSGSLKRAKPIGGLGPYYVDLRTPPREG